MIITGKEEYICLSIYSRLIEKVYHNKNKTIASLQKELQEEDSQIYDWNKIYDICNFYLLKKYFSWAKDSYFPYMSNNYLKDFDINSYFVDSTTASNFTPKTFINNLRIALNHSNNNKLCKLIIEDGELFVEINMKEAQINKNERGLFHVKIPQSDFTNISLETFLSAPKINYFSFNFDNPDLMKHKNFTEALKSIYLRRFYIKGKMQEEQIYELSKKVKDNYYGCLPNESVEVDLGDNYGGSADYRLTEKQIKTIEEKFDKKIGLIDENAYRELIALTMPIGIFKENLILFHLNLMTAIYKSNFDINEYFKTLIGNQDRFNTIRDLIYFHDNDYFINFIKILSFSSYFETLDNNTICHIGGEDIEKNLIRNSFVHGKWFMSGGTIELFDGPLGDKGEMTFRDEKSISIEDTEKYIQFQMNIEKNEMTNIVIDPPDDKEIEIHYDENNVPIYMDCIENGIRIIMLFNNSESTKDNPPWGIRVDRGDGILCLPETYEVALFNTALRKTNRDLLIEHLNLFKNISRMFSLQIQYLQGNITFEELMNEGESVLEPYKKTFLKNDQNEINDR